MCALVCVGHHVHAPDPPPPPPLQTYAAWQRIYSRQKALLYVLLLLDVIYMCALIIVQQNWSATDSGERAEPPLASHRLG